MIVEIASAPASRAMLGGKRRLRTVIRRAHSDQSQQADVVEPDKDQDSYRGPDEPLLDCQPHEDRLPQRPKVQKASTARLT